MQTLRLMINRLTQSFVEVFTALKPFEIKKLILLIELINVHSYMYIYIYIYMCVNGLLFNEIWGSREMSVRCFSAGASFAHYHLCAPRAEGWEVKSALTDEASFPVGRTGPSLYCEWKVFC